MPSPYLPAEVIEAIIRRADFSDLKAFILVSRAFHSQASRRLFRKLSFWADENIINAAPPLGTRLRDYLHASMPLAFMKFVKVIEFRAPVVQNPRPFDSCSYYDESLKKFGSPAPKIIQIFEQLKENSLRGFVWQLPTCIPDGILSAGSCLVSKQKAIETMSLVTFRCIHGRSKEPYVFTNFRRIRSFSWIGLESLAEINAARDFLKSNREILQSLELNFVYWTETEEQCNSREDYIDPVDNVFAKYVLPRGSDDLIQEFRSLQKLSLTEAPLTGVVIEIASALNISRLRFLKLDDCADTPRLLHAIATAKTPLMLLSLELTMEDQIEANWAGSALVRFLNSFEGLEDLHLLITPACPALTYWQAAAKHRSTLRNFAYHERVRGNREFRFEDQYLGYGMYQYSPSCEENQLRILLSLDLDCLGYCTSSLNFYRYYQCHHDKLKPLAIKLLHIRRSAEELDRTYPRSFKDFMAKVAIPLDQDWPPDGHYEFFSCVEWAFESEHFPELQILAFGDFAHGGRFSDRSLLFCRETKPNSDFPFRVMQRSEWVEGTGAIQPFGLAKHEMVHFEGIHQPFEFLAACPAEPFINHRYFDE